jgi:hypothetical protein
VTAPIVAAGQGNATGLHAPSNVSITIAGSGGLEVKVAESVHVNGQIGGAGRIFKSSSLQRGVVTAMENKVKGSRFNEEDVLVVRLGCAPRLARQR